MQKSTQNFCSSCCFFTKKLCLLTTKKMNPTFVFTDNNKKTRNEAQPLAFTYLKIQLVSLKHILQLLYESLNYFRILVCVTIWFYLVIVDLLIRDWSQTSDRLWCVSKPHNILLYDILFQDTFPSYCYNYHSLQLNCPSKGGDDDSV